MGLETELLAGFVDSRPASNKKLTIIVPMYITLWNLFPRV